MKISFYKKAIALSSLTLFVSCDTSVSWTEPNVLSAFMKTCNPANDSKLNAICNCAVDKIKVKYPDASKADTISSSDIESFTKECVASNTTPTQ